MLLPCCLGNAWHSYSRSASWSVWTPSCDLMSCSCMLFDRHWTHMVTGLLHVAVGMGCWGCYCQQQQLVVYSNSMFLEGHQLGYHYSECCHAAPVNRYDTRTCTVQMCKTECSWSLRLPLSLTKATSKSDLQIQIYVWLPWNVQSCAAWRIYSYSHHHDVPLAWQRHDNL